MKQLIHTPEGVRDIFGRECDKKRYLEHRIERMFRSYGYQSIETPTFEYFDVFSKEVGTTPSRNLYKFFDREGNTLVLRPDFTPSIARAVAMYFQEETGPLRLCYHGSVYENGSSYQLRLHESTQMGVEFLNDNSPEADAEIIAMVVKTMRKSGLKDFQVSIGHVGYFEALAREAEMDEETIRKMKDMLMIQNRFGAQELVDSLHLREDLRRALNTIPELFGNQEVLSRARALTTNREAVAAVDRLSKIYDILKTYGCENDVAFDFGMVTQHRYYTGIIFQAYTYGTGDAIIKGGRYDRLLQYFGKDAAAIGFAVEIEALMSALDRQKIRVPIADVKTMVLYPTWMEKTAIRFAQDNRERGMDVACVRFADGKLLDDYRAYGKRNQFGGIIYFRSMTEAYAINLGTGEVETVDISKYEVKDE